MQPSNVYDQTIQKLIQWRQDPRAVWGQSTGLAPLDGLTGGLHNEELTLLAGRPSMGKSALAMQIAYHRAREYRRQGLDRRVVIFSAEMSGWQVVLREASRLARIPSTSLKRGYVSDAELEFVQGIIQDMRVYPLILDDTHGITADQMHERLRRWLDSGPEIGLVVFDHLHLGGGDREYERIGALSSRLQYFAKRLSVPVLALAQLSRKTEDRQPPVPVISDLRGTGSLEQDADNVLFVYRPRWYEPFADQNEAHEAHIIVAKARNNGELGTARVEFVPRFTEFRAPEEL